MLWRVRTSLHDHPGSLARLAAVCGENELNILALQIFPDLSTVTDELVVEAAEQWTATDLAALVATAGGGAVSVAPCETTDLVDEPVRWLRAARRMLAEPAERARIMADLAGSDQHAWSFSENARMSALLELVGAVSTVELPAGAGEVVVYDVHDDAVLARVGGTVVGTGLLEPSGQMSVAVTPQWRRKGVGRQVFTALAGVARHAGYDEVVLVAPADDEGTMGMLTAAGVRGLIKLSDGHLHIRVGLRGIRTVVPSAGPLHHVLR